MDTALAMARSGLGTTAPNPSVGCVLARDGHIVGTGVTAPGGRPHAERCALDMAGDAASGATAYVTLEPCAHFGQTPPCAEALIAAGIARVVIACTDPDPRTAGQGIEKLTNAGIRVETGLRQTEAETLHAGFFHLVRRGWPLVAIDDHEPGFDLALEQFDDTDVLAALKALGARGITRLRLVPGSVAAQAAEEANLVDMKAASINTRR